ncbi:hypothetical protein ACFLTP_02600 [Chloroflexota bacterium]
MAHRGIDSVAHPVVNVPVHPVNMHIVEPPKGIIITIFGSIYQSVNFRKCVGSVIFQQLAFLFTKRMLLIIVTALGNEIIDH